MTETGSTADVGCPTCGRPVAADGRWCGRCGARVADPEPADGRRGGGALLRPGTLSADESAAATSSDPTVVHQTEPQAAHDEAAPPTGASAAAGTSRRRRVVALIVAALLVGGAAATALRGPGAERRVATQARGDARMDGVVSERTPEAPSGVAWTATVEPPALDGGGWIGTGVFRGAEDWVAVEQPLLTITTIRTGTDSSRLARRTVREAYPASDDLLLEREDDRVVAVRLPELEVAWTADVDGPVGRFGAPYVELLADGPLVVPAAGRIVALDPDDGTVVWERPSDLGGSGQVREPFAVSEEDPSAPFGRRTRWLAVPARVDGEAVTELVAPGTGEVEGTLPRTVWPEHLAPTDDGDLLAAVNRTGEAARSSGPGGIADAIERWRLGPDSTMRRTARIELDGSRLVSRLTAMPGGWATAGVGNARISLLVAIDGDAVAWERELGSDELWVADGETVLLSEPDRPREELGVTELVTARLDRAGRDVLDPADRGRPLGEVREADQAGTPWGQTDVRLASAGVVVEGDGWSQAVPDELGTVAVTDGETVAVARRDGLAAFDADGTASWTWVADRPEQLGVDRLLYWRQPTALAIEAATEQDEARVVVIPPLGLQDTSLGLGTGLVDGSGPDVEGPVVEALAVAPGVRVTTGEGRVLVDLPGEDDTRLASETVGRDVRVAIDASVEPSLVVVAGTDGVTMLPVGDEDPSWTDGDLAPCGDPVLADAAGDDAATALVALEDGEVVALDIASGERRWTHEGPPPTEQLRELIEPLDPSFLEPTPRAAIPVETRLAACPVLLPHGDAVHVVGATEVTTLSLDDGAPADATVGLPTAPATLPVRAGDVALFATLADELVGVDLGDGTTWAVALPSPAAGSPVVLDDGTIVVPTVDGLAALR